MLVVCGKVVYLRWFALMHDLVYCDGDEDGDDGCSEYDWSLVCSGN